MLDLGAGVRLYDIVYYDRADREDLCRLVAMQTEQARALQEQLDYELYQLEMSTLELDYGSSLVQARLKKAYTGFYYVMSLRWLQLARWHEFEFDDIRFYRSQTKVAVHNRVVHCTSQEAEWRDRAHRVGIAVERLRAEHLL